VKYNTSDRTYIIRQAELLFRLANPDSLVFTKHFKLKWLADSNAIVCFLVIDINETWGSELIVDIEKAADQFVNFLRLFNICSITSFATVSDAPNLELMDMESFVARNEICNGLKMVNACGSRWESIIASPRGRYYQTIQFAPTAI
jgi:hypothetical protein